MLFDKEKSVESLIWLIFFFMEGTSSVIDWNSVKTDLKKFFQTSIFRTEKLFRHFLFFGNMLLLLSQYFQERDW